MCRKNTGESKSSFHHAKNRVKNVDSLDSFDSLNLNDDDMLKSVKNSENNISSVKPMLYNFEINNNTVPLEIDSGSCASLINRKSCEDLNLVILPTSKSNFKSYTNEPIPLLGETNVKAFRTCRPLDM